MPPNRSAAAVTDRYRRRLIDLRDDSASAVAAMFLSLVDLDATPAALDQALASWRARAAALAASSAEQGTVLTIAYLSAYLQAAGASPLTVDVPRAAPDPSALGVVRGALLYRLARGSGRELAVASAVASARRNTREVVGRAAVETLADGIRLEPQITGWQRVTSSSCCERCAVIAGRVFADSADFDRHPACRCSREAVVSGRAETVQRQAPTVVAP